MLPITIYHIRKYQPKNEKLDKPLINFQTYGYWYDLILCKKVQLKLKTLTRKYIVGQIHDIIKLKKNQYLTIWAVECELHHSRLFFLDKNRTHFLKLCIRSKRVIVCSESSFVWSDVYLFVQDSTIIFQWSVAALFQYTFVETFTAK